MNVIIAGTRTFADYDIAKEWLDKLLSVEEIGFVFSGACDRGVLTFTRPDGTKVYGADGLGERWASENNKGVREFRADWFKDGRSAGPIRNQYMAYHCGKEDICIVFHDEISKGSADMIKKAKVRGMRTEVIKYMQHA